MGKLLLALLAIAVLVSCGTSGIGSADNNGLIQKKIAKIEKEGNLIDVWVPTEFQPGDTISVEYSTAVQKYKYKHYHTSECDKAVIIR